MFYKRPAFYLELKQNQEQNKLKEKRGNFWKFLTGNLWKFLVEIQKRKVCKND